MSNAENTDSDLRLELSSGCFDPEEAISRTCGFCQAEIPMHDDVFMLKSTSSNREPFYICHACYQIHNTLEKYIDDCKTEVTEEAAKKNKNQICNS